MSLGAGALRGTAYFLRCMYWTHTSALLFAEGGATQRLIGPNYLFVAGDRSAAYDPRPHLSGVLLVAVHEAPENTNLLDVFAELRHKFC